MKDTIAMENNGRPSVLVVDDLETNILAMRQILEPCDVDIVTAVSGEDALSIAMRRDFAMVLLDIQMPGMDGYDTAEMMRLNKSTQTTPIIFVTANNESAESTFKGYEKGAVDCLYKPLDPAVVRSKVTVFAELSRQNRALKESHMALEDLNAKLGKAGEELERSNSDFRDFAHTAAHDLKAPLRHIGGFCELVGTSEADRLSDDGREILGQVTEAVDRLTALIDSLLKYADVNAAAINFEVVNLNEVVKEVVLDFGDIIRKTDAHVEIEELPTVDGDTSQMYQVLQNIIGNALKYHRPDVPPVIKVSSRSLHERRSSGKLNQELCQIVIEDNGIGFDEALVDHVFAPFKRLVTQREFDGSGIGLGTVSKIVERHGGSITAKSIVGEGSTFFVTLRAGGDHRRPT